jgi:predicted transposase YdaD
MLHDLLHVDPMYQAIVQEGRQEGRQEERQARILDLQQTALALIQANFCQLEEVAKPRISALGDLQRLQQLVRMLISAHSEEDVHQAFSACNPDEPVH